MMDMMDMYYPDTDDEDARSFEMPPPPDSFVPSWCRNGHDLRIDPNATVVYIATYSRSWMQPASPLSIKRNGHSHPMMVRGVVTAINHGAQTVRIGSEDIEWDLVVGRLDSSKHSSSPLALYGFDCRTDDPSPDDTFDRFWTRRTLDFSVLARDMADIKSAYITHLLGISDNVKPGTLASASLCVFEGVVAVRAAVARTSFFAAADEMCTDVWAMKFVSV